jgi:hypothetical protein
MSIIKRILPRNWTSGRSGRQVEMVIVHTYDGSGKSLFNWFSRESTKASAHYAIFLDGDIEHLVEEADTAWHAGVWDINCKSIGIEHQDLKRPEDSVRTPELYESSAQLIADIYRRHGLPFNDMGRIKPHREYSPKRTCPGGLDLERIRNRVREILNPPAPPPVKPVPSDFQGSIATIASEIGMSDKDPKMVTKEVIARLEALKDTEARVAELLDNQDGLKAEISVRNDEINRLARLLEAKEQTSTWEAVANILRKLLKINK